MESGTHSTTITGYFPILGLHIIEHKTKDTLSYINRNTSHTSDNKLCCHSNDNE